MMENLKRFRIEFTVDVHYEGVTKDWDYSNDDIKNFALQELECMSPYPFDITFSEADNPWHTGTPTEEGDYLCWVKGSFGIKHGLYYNRCKYKDGNWFDDEVTNYNLKNLCFQVIAWQKITPYKREERK